MYILEYYEFVIQQILFHWSVVKPEAEPVLRGRCLWGAELSFVFGFLLLPSTPAQATQAKPETTRTCHGVGALVHGCCLLCDRQCTERLPSSVLSQTSDWATPSSRRSGTSAPSVERELISVSCECKAKSVQCPPQCPSHSQHCRIVPLCYFKTVWERTSEINFKKALKT